jgi:hypothetical protein
MFLRPEGENGRSGIANVIPEMDGWHGKMHDPIGVNWFAELNVEGERFVTVATPTRSVSDGILA